MYKFIRRCIFFFNKTQIRGFKKPSHISEADSYWLPTFQTSYINTQFCSRDLQPICYFLSWLHIKQSLVLPSLFCWWLECAPPLEPSSLFRFQSTLLKSSIMVAEVEVGLAVVAVMGP